MPRCSDIVPVAPHSAPVNPADTREQVPSGASSNPSSTPEAQNPDIAINDSDEPSPGGGGEPSGEVAGEIRARSAPPAEEDEPIPEEPAPIVR